MIQVQRKCVTFFPPKDAISLMGDFTDWDEAPLPIYGPITLEFPEGAYVEYAFLDANKRPLADPDNSQTPRYPWYAYHRAITLPQNSFQDPPRPERLRGQLSEQVLLSEVWASQRRCYVYEPPVQPTATLYVQDGEAFYQRLRFHEVVEALIEEERIQPLRLVLIEPVDRRAEYWFNERYEAFLLHELIPALDHRFGETAGRGL